MQGGPCRHRYIYCAAASRPVPGIPCAEENTTIGSIPISKMTFEAGGVAHAQFLVCKQRLPLLRADTLLSDHIERRRKAVAYRADNLAVLYGSGRVDKYAAEHLHVDAAVEHLYESVVRQTCIGLQEHQRNLALGREHRSVALWMLLRKMRCQFFRHFLQRKQGMDASELAYSEALAIFFQKIVFCKR